MSNYKKVLSLTQQELEVLTSTHDSLSSLLSTLNINSRDTRSRTKILEMISNYGISWDRGSNRNKRFDDATLISAVEKALCLSDVIRGVGLLPVGRNHQTVQRRIDKLGLSTTHFNVSEALKRNKKQSVASADPVEYIKTASRQRLRPLVIRYDLVEYKCVSCGNDGNWLNKPITLELDHMDGDSTNNEINNLRFLCPNCHSQTETFGRKRRK